MQSKLRVAEAKVQTRPYLETLLKDVIPSWIANLKFVCQKDKLAVSFLFALTPSAEALILRKRDLSIVLNWDVIADFLNTLWDAFSRKVNHNENPIPVCLEEEEWDELFKKVCIHMPLQKTVIRKMLEPIQIEELGELCCLLIQIVVCKISMILKY